MKVVVRAKAVDDLDGIFDWIAKDNPRAAEAMVMRIRGRIGRHARADRGALHHRLQSPRGSR
jgi:plasmid stabilization system protein ParE